MPWGHPLLYTRKYDNIFQKRKKKNGHGENDDYIDIDIINVDFSLPRDTSKKSERSRSWIIKENEVMQNRRVHYLTHRKKISFCSQKLFLNVLKLTEYTKILHKILFKKLQLTDRNFSISWLENILFKKIILRTQTVVKFLPIPPKSFQQGF